MKHELSGRWPLFAALLCMSLGACVSLPTLVQVARERQYGNNKQDAVQGMDQSTAQASGSYTTLATSGTGSTYRRWLHRNDLSVSYIITDLDVVNWTDRVKVIIAKHCDQATLLRYSSATGQDALTTLAGAASLAGWSTATASGLGLGATFISTLGSTFDSKGDAALYDDAFTNIQDAENLYYFYSMGMQFDKNGKVTPDSWKVRRADVPSCHYYSAQAETLQHRVIAAIKVLDAALARKIPDLQDLKDAKGDTSTTNIQSPGVKTSGS